MKLPPAVAAAAAAAAAGDDDDDYDDDDDDSNSNNSFDCLLHFVADYRFCTNRRFLSRPNGTGRMQKLQRGYVCVSGTSPW